MSFINPIAFGDYSVAQLFTTTFTLKKLSATAATTTLVSVKRYTYGGTDDTVANDISVRGAISGQVVTMADFFLATFFPAFLAGFFFAAFFGVFFPAAATFFFGGLCFFGAGPAVAALGG